MATIKPIKGNFFVKWLHSGLYDAAAQIECDSCEQFWNVRTISRFMRDSRMGGYVISDLDYPVGYVAFESVVSNREIVIHNLVIRHDYRKQGLGTILLDRVATKIDSNKSPRPPRFLSTYVRETNLGGHLFLKKYGFQAEGVEKNYFEDTVFGDESQIEDAYRFTFK